jgi:hypothetical protein
MTMRHEINHRTFYARPDTVSDDFGLLLEAVADAFRAMSTRPFHTHWSCLRSAGC